MQQTEAQKDFSLRRPTHSQKRMRKEKRRPASFEMTGLWSLFLLAFALRPLSATFAPLSCDKQSTGLKTGHHNPRQTPG
jgi:hypothetical protein